MTELSEYADCVQGQRCLPYPLNQLEGEAKPVVEALNELLDSYQDVTIEDSHIGKDAQEYAAIYGAEEHAPLIAKAAKIIVDGECATSTRY